LHALRETALALGLLLAACSARPAVVDTAKEAGALLSGLHAAGNFSGAVIIGRNGEIIYEGALGTADGIAPFTPETAADGGSLAKPFTATSIWLLASEGEFSLDEPVQTYVPEFPHAGTRILDLLGHSAGLADYGAFQALLDGGQPVDTRALLNEQQRNFPRPLFAAGSQFDYCNLCFDTLRWSSSAYPANPTRTSSASVSSFRRE
jgi:N-acyl-D-amino-acid deacylase